MRIFDLQCAINLFARPIPLFSGIVIFVLWVSVSSFQSFVLGICDVKFGCKGTVQFSMLILITFGSIIAFTSFNYLLKYVSPEKVATSTYVNPIIALILGRYFLNEQISTQSVVAAVVLLTGVYFINTSKKLMAN